MLVRSGRAGRNLGRYTAQCDEQYENGEKETTAKGDRKFMATSHRAGRNVGLIREGT
jgi:hypothetical protein